MSSLVYTNNKMKSILLLGKDLTDGLDDNNLNAEKEHYVNFTEEQKELCLNLLFNGVDSHMLVKGVEIYKFKATHSEIIVAPLYLGNVSKDLLIDDMKITERYGFVYDFPSNYGSIDFDDFLNIYKKSMRKHNIK